MLTLQWSSVFNLRGSGWIFECFITCQSHPSSAICHRRKKPYNSYLTSRVFCWHLEQSNFNWNMTRKFTGHDYKLSFHLMKNQKMNVSQWLCPLCSFSKWGAWRGIPALTCSMHGELPQVLSTAGHGAAAARIPGCWQCVAMQLEGHWWMVLLSLLLLFCPTTDSSLKLF